MVRRDCSGGGKRVVPFGTGGRVALGPSPPELRGAPPQLSPPGPQSAATKCHGPSAPLGTGRCRDRPLRGSGFTQPPCAGAVASGTQCAALSAPRESQVAWLPLRGH